MVVETEKQARYKNYLLSDHWKDLRARALKRDGHQCTRCPCRWALEVHHLFYRKRWEDSVVEDLITLCGSCHEREHGRGKTQSPVPWVAGSAGNRRRDVHGNWVSRRGKVIKFGKKKHRHRKHKRRKFDRVIWNIKKRNWSF